MTAPARPGDRPALPRILTAVALPCAVVSALVVGGAVAAAPASVRAPLGLGASAAALLLCVAVTLAAHALWALRLLRRRLDAATADAGRLAEERVRLAERTRREQERLRMEFADERARLTAEFAQERERLAQRHAEEVARLGAETDRVRARLDRATAERDAAVAATANAAARMQALATGMLADLRAMEERHSDEEVLTDLLHLDHRTAQAGRLADSVAVLAGARSGRRWARPIGMESILRGAMGRIAGYQRVRVHSTSETAVAGHAAEGVMHALAEILDNAANFSPPTAEVHVYVEEVPSGLIVSVEDSGLVMGEVQLRRAERAVSGEFAGLGGLSGTRLGLAVVGRLSRKYGLKVSFRPSARGGTGVLVLIPQDILSDPAPTPVPTPAAAPVTQPARPAPDGPSHLAVPPPAAPSYRTAHAEPAPAHEPAGREPDGQDTGERPVSLPRRRRGRTLAEAERARAGARTAEPRPAPAADDAKTRAARFSSFRQAVRASGGGPAAPRETESDPAGPVPTGVPAETPAEAPSDHPSHSHAHPEGDTTS
ncbi:ATP-binding protein [Streptomyces sp. HMX87]|uniref:sensor histidine kinase n=1 Tax=Streptomyces sp. HMX87 TaxID=3390849 RepID=UPI003A8BAEAC